MLLSDIEEKYRKAGLDEVLAHWLALLKFQESSFSRMTLEQTLGVSIALVTICDCCGPEYFSFDWFGDEIRINMFTGDAWIPRPIND